jgi:hypothetical protein
LSVPVPVSRRHGPTVAVGMSLLLAISLGACSSSSTKQSEPPLGFRPLPSFLPSADPVGEVVTASPGHPQLAVQGVAVNVNLPGGKVLAQVTGPHVPPFVAPPPPQVTATFDVSLTHVSGTVPIRLADFSITDQDGRNFHPTFVHGVTPPPSSVTTGKDLTFQVTAVMPSGEGRLYWSPAKTQPIVSWDFIVEND